MTVFCQITILGNGVKEELRKDFIRSNTLPI